MLCMGEGSKIEVFSGHCFWEATIEAKGRGGFYFTYDGSDDEFGFVYTDDFLETWRLSDDGFQIQLTSSNLEHMRDPCH